MSGFAFPIGYHKFHKKQLFNFQLNRWYSLGYARFEDMEQAGKGIKHFNDWYLEMHKLAEEAVLENRLMNAAFYYRAAELYAKSNNPEKEFLYDRFIELFYKAFENEIMEKHKVPYNGAFLPALRIPPVSQKKAQSSFTAGLILS